jgi:hypothetical protein
MLNVWSRRRHRKEGEKEGKESEDESDLSVEERLRKLERLVSSMVEEEGREGEEEEVAADAEDPVVAGVRRV